MSSISDQPIHSIPIPTWVTSMELEDDHATLTRKATTVEGAEILLPALLVVAAGLVLYTPTGVPRIWLPHNDEAITLEQAQETLTALQELIPVLEEV